jgi:formamidopyrimidine-DNA glycosylase
MGLDSRSAPIIVCMPELPEVEVARQSFASFIDGARVQTVVMGLPLRWPLGRSPAALQDAQVGAATRRGKYLWLPLKQPAHPHAGLLLHLGMSGSLTFGTPADLPPHGKHDHFELHTSKGVLRLTDPRRFGAVVWSASLKAEPAASLLSRLGAEPFDEAFTAQHFHAALQRRRISVKAALLGGDIVVGAGNIYACEALFAAGIDPRLRCDRLSRPRAARLLEAVRQTLLHALALGGSTLRDFRDAHGMAGSYQTHAQVYGREGQPCGRCATPVRRIVQGQRATYFCPVCQRR